MAKMAERGSVLWFLLSAIQLWMAFAMMEEATAAVELLFGSSAAACFVLGVFVFRQEQKEFKLNPLKLASKEVHDDMREKQGKGFWTLVIIWFTVMATTSLFL